MSRTRLASRITALAGLTFALCPRPALACAACFGKSDSAMARGMNMGIFSLLIVIVGVLACVAGFFVFLGVKSGQSSGRQNPAGPQNPSQEYRPDQLMTRTEHD